MKIIRQGGLLQVAEIEELAAANAGAFRSALEPALCPAVEQIQIDLSRTAFVDCGGLGALIALRNRLRRCNPNASVHLLNPTRSVQRIIHLTRLDHLFPIDTVPSRSPEKPSARQKRSNPPNVTPRSIPVLS